MNNLLFEKIWEDADFYQIIVKALAKNISAETKVYVTKENIIALSDLIKNLIDKQHSEFYWEIGDTDLSAESFFSIGLAEYDNLQSLETLPMFLQFLCSSYPGNDA